MTQTASFPASSRSRLRQVAAEDGSGPGFATQTGTVDPRVLARLARYVENAESAAPARRAAPFQAKAQTHEAPVLSGADAAGAAGRAAPSGDLERAAGVSPNPSARHESVSAAPPSDMAALEQLPRKVTADVLEAVDARLSTVDDHLSALTQTLTSHPAWNMDRGFSRLESRLQALADLLHDMGARNLTAEQARLVAEETARAAQQAAVTELAATVARPLLEAIDQATDRITRVIATPAPGPGPGSAPHAEVVEAAETLRLELADATAGQTRTIARVETRLSDLQESVMALTEQLRASREAAEAADRMAHERAMAVLDQHVGPAPVCEAPAYHAEPAHPEPAPEPLAPAALPRAGQLGEPTAGPSAENMADRLIAAARRAGPAQPSRGRPGPAASRRPAPKARGARSAVPEWLRGRGLLWIAVAAVTAGSTPMLAPVIRAIPTTFWPSPDMGVSPAQAAPTKIGAQLTDASRSGSIVDDPAALYALADRLAEGANVSSAKLTVSLVEKAAERGQPLAQFRLARLYEKGAGVDRDPNKARLWYLRAAEQGNVRAMHNLAVLYADGALGKPDYAAAGRWFRQAADRGLADSQYNLGVLLARGLGESANPAEAWKWFEIAARSGDAEAASRRDEVTAALSPAALDNARAAAGSWRAAPVNAQANDPVTGSRQASNRKKPGSPV